MRPLWEFSQLTVRGLAHTDLNIIRERNIHKKGTHSTGIHSKSQGADGKTALTEGALEQSLMPLPIILTVVDVDAHF